MKTKRYNTKTFVFTVNGEQIYFYCSTTYTKNGFCHHVYTVGGGKENEHSRLSYLNRTWESFEYETALLYAVDKFPKSMREPLRLEIQAVAQNEHEKVEAFCAAFAANFAALSTEQKKFVQEHTPIIQNMDQAKTVNAVVSVLAAL